MKSLKPLLKMRAATLEVFIQTEISTATLKMRSLNPLLKMKSL